MFGYTPYPATLYPKILLPPKANKPLKKGLERENSFQEILATAFL